MTQFTSGQRVMFSMSPSDVEISGMATVVAPLDESLYDKEDVGQMYLIRIDGCDVDSEVFEDELTETN